MSKRARNRAAVNREKERRAREQHAANFAEAIRQGLTYAEPPRERLRPAAYWAEIAQKAREP